MLSSGQLNQNLLPLLHKVTFYDLVSLRLFTRLYIIELIFNGLQTGIPTNTKCHYRNTKFSGVSTLFHLLNHSVENFLVPQIASGHNPEDTVLPTIQKKVSVLFIPKFLNWQVWKFLDLSDLGIADQVSEAPS
ncbi:hypothetical protein ACFX2I_031075 [Malus domestica]